MMKLFAKMSCFITAIMLTLITACPAVSASGPQISAECACLVCAESGETLFEKNADKRHSMASTTKIMTALLLIEQRTPLRNVRVTEEMTSVEGTSIGLVPGDTISFEALIYGMLLESGNDAATAAAIASAGSTEDFAGLMNRRAAEIGMTSTHFVTPSGLDAEEHYSTARDMCRLACEAMKEPFFAFVVSQKEAVVEYGASPYPHKLSNHNRLLSAFPDAVGVKTGFTRKSGRCLVSAAKRGGVTLVAVTLNDPDDWNDHESLFEYGFSRCFAASLPGAGDLLSVPVTGGRKPMVKAQVTNLPVVVYDGEISVKMYLRPFEYAPVGTGDLLGKAVYYGDGRVLGCGDIVACEDIAVKPVFKVENNEELSPFYKVINRVAGFFGGLKG